MNEITDDERVKVVAWLEQHLASACPACGGSYWAVGDRGLIIREILARDGQSLSLGGVGLEVVSVLCDRCGYVLLFAMKRILGELDGSGDG